MIWQQRVHVVVMLTKVYEFIRVMCSQYWPMALNQPEIIGDHFEVTLVDEDKLADYIVRTMKVKCLKNSKESEIRTIYQLHFLSWHMDSCPYSDSILKFHRRVQLYLKECKSKESGPLLVHCR